MMKEDTLRKTTATLEVYFEQLLRHVEQPIFVKDKTYPRWRFPNEGVAEAVLLKGARIISALNALIHLLRSGHVQEMYVICRTMDDFFVEIAFLLEGFPNEDLSVTQRKFLDDFYQEEFDRPENPFESTQKRNTVSRKKMYASMGRTLSDIVDPQHGQELFRTIGQTNSGYVHGAYPHIMELYGGNPPKFHLDGMLNTPKEEEAIQNSKHYFYRGIQALMFIALAFQNPSVFDDLKKLRDEFEKETGYDPTGALSKVIHLPDGTKKTKKGT